MDASCSPATEPLLVTTALSISEAVQILEHPPDKFVTTPPQRPKAGEVYLFRSRGEINKQGSYTIIIVKCVRGKNICSDSRTYM